MVSIIQYCQCSFSLFTRESVGVMARLHSSWSDRLVPTPELDGDHLGLAEHHLLLLLSSHHPPHNKSLCCVNPFPLLPLLNAALGVSTAPHRGADGLSWSPNRLAGPATRPISRCLGRGDADNWPSWALDRHRRGACWGHPVRGRGHPGGGSFLLQLCNSMKLCNSSRTSSNLTSRSRGQPLSNVKCLGSDGRQLKVIPERICNVAIIHTSNKSLSNRLNENSLWSLISYLKRSLWSSPPLGSAVVPAPQSWLLEQSERSWRRAEGEELTRLTITFSTRLIGLCGGMNLWMELKIKHIKVGRGWWWRTDLPRRLD